MSTDVTIVLCLMIQKWEQSKHPTANYVSGFPCGSDGKVSACSVGDTGLISGSGRSPKEGNGNPLQYPCLENSMGRGAWQVTVHGVAKSRTQLKQPSTHTRCLKSAGVGLDLLTWLCIRRALN